MGKLDPILAKAVRLLRRKKYESAVKALEPEVNRFYGVFHYYYILALSYLYAKVFNVAFTYFKLARDIKMRDTQVLLGFAALYLRRGETDRAVDLYLEAQDLDPRNKQARQALKIIKKYSGTEHLSAWVESKGFFTVFPPLPKAPPGPALPLLCGACALAALALALVRLHLFPPPFFPFAGKKPPRDGLAPTALEQGERDAPVQIDGSYRYVLTSREAVETYEEARARFTGYRDEAAKRALNRLFESNASEAVKAKARILLSYTEVPGFDTLKDRFAYPEVKSDPVLYRGCYVVWRGMAANLEVLESSTAFNLLVGYDTKSALQGVVPVRFDFSIPVNTEHPLEVLGRVVPVSAGGGLDVRLEGVALHQSALLRREGP